MGDDEQKKQGTSRGVVILISVPLLLMVYFFSAIPVGLALRALPRTMSRPLEKPFEAFYAPLEWLCENNKTVSDIFEEEYKLMSGKP